MRLLIAIISLLSIYTTAAFGQFNAEGDFIITKATGLDAAIIFTDINTGKVAFTNPTTGTPNFAWTKYYTPGIGQINEQITTDISNNLSTSISATNNGEGGYILEFDSAGIPVKKIIWISDYEFNKPEIDSIGVYEVGTAFNTSIDLCKNIILKTFYTNTAITYTLPNAPQTFTLPKTTIVDYGTHGKEELHNNMQYLQIAAPFDDIKFEATVKEQFIALNGIDKTVLTTGTIDTTYIAKAVKIEGINYNITIDSLGNNEVEQETSGILGGSAPLETYLTPNNASSKVVYYEWEIWKNTTIPSSTIRYFNREARHTFKDKVNEGTEPDYYAKLTISNDYCKTSDSIEVKIITSYLDAPNIMIIRNGTPAEEFRVAFKSIGSFKGYIYNRWGRLVFEWNNPSKGWDGRHNGKLVAPGVYYYVIRAKGTDGASRNKSGSITLLRPKN